MTKAQLRKLVINTGSKFFDRSSMRFFGDTMANFIASSKPIEIVDSQGVLRQVYWLQRKRQISQLTTGWWSDPYYFDARTFERVHPTRGG